MKTGWSAIAFLVIPLVVLAGLAGYVGTRLAQPPHVEIVARRADLATATKIVAAFDSADKSRADYVGDGKDDQVEIQAAIDSLGDTGGKVFLLEGTYNLSAAIRIDRSMVLEGIGAGYKIFAPGYAILPLTRLRLADGANSNMIEVGNETLYVHVVHIKNMYLDGNKANQTSTSHGIVVGAKKQIDGLWVQDIAFSDVRDDSFRNVNGIDIWINRSTFEDGDGAYLNFLGGEGESSRYIWVVDPYFAGGKSHVRISGPGSYAISIKGGVSFDSGQHAILLDRPSHDILISDMEILGTGTTAGAWSGIYAEGVKHLVVRDSFVRQPSSVGGGTGIYLSNVEEATLVGNHIYGWKQGGLVLDDSTYNVVSANNLMDNALGADNAFAEILLKGDSTHNAVQSNIIRETTDAKARYGIREDSQGDDYNILMGNIVSGVGGEGVLRQGPNSVTEGNVVSPVRD